MVTRMLVNNGEIHEVAILPKMVLRIVITNSAPYEPIKTTLLKYRVAIIIARKNVLSPTSQTRIVKKDVVKPA